jgi:hypothetical protein
VHIVAVGGELHRVVHLDVVVAGIDWHDPEGGRVHVHRIAHGEREVVPVRVSRPGCPVLIGQSPLKRPLYQTFMWWLEVLAMAMSELPIRNCPARLASP